MTREADGLLSTVVSDAVLSDAAGAEEHGEEGEGGMEDGSRGHGLEREMAGVSGLVRGLRELPIYVDQGGSENEAEVNEAEVR